jgi:3-oxosteroid 1-dehydrogenase
MLSITKGNKMFDETFDWVVVGSGGASMCSALRMREAGKSVLILEKTEYVGGTTARSGGVMWIPNNPFMKQDGVDDSYEQALLYLDTLLGEDPTAKGATRARREVYLRECVAMLELLQRSGIQQHRAKYWPDYHTELAGASEAGRAVLPKPFNINKLGPWKHKLRPGFLMFPATLEEAMLVPRHRYMPEGRLVMLKVGLRIAAGLLTGKRWAGAGAGLQGAMLHASLQAGVDIRTDSPVSELIIEDGVVTGVISQGADGRPRRIGAKLGVLVNAGGFAHNQRMRDQYIPGTSTAWSSAANGDTGEMIEEMARCGAALSQMNERVGNQATLPPGSERSDYKPGAQQLTASPHAILVDQSGVRYMNEGGSYMTYCQGMLERHKTVGALPSWAVFDQQYVDRYMLAGVKPTPKLLAQWREAGYLKQADSIEGLAEQINVETKTLQGTVERFNGFVMQNYDEDFQRGERAYDNWLGDPTRTPSATLGTIEKGPFYAVPVQPGDVGTYGGVVTDEHARVLQEDGSVIPGLYAAGVSTASVMGRSYPGAGSSVGPAFTWGYVAAQHALGH